MRKALAVATFWFTGHLYGMLPIQGKMALLFRLVAVPIAAMLAAHVMVYRQYPWDSNYQFPWAYVLTIATIMLCCWEVNVWVFRRLDRRLPFHQNPVRRIGRQVLEGGLFTGLTFGVVFPLISRLGYGAWPSAGGFTTGLFICFSIATLINGIYVGFYLLCIIYGQQAATARQLNATLTESAALSPAPIDQSGSVVRSAAVSSILIETGRQTLRLQPDEIAYFYSSAGMVQLIQPDGRRLTTNYDSLTNLTDRLPPTQFFQISRQFLVHPNAVRTIRDDVNRKLCLTLAPGLSANQPTEQVVISRYRSAEFKRWFLAATTV